MEQTLTIGRMAASAKAFCAQYGGVPQETLYGVTDGKAVGTFVEHLFEDYLSQRYDMVSGNSARGLGLPSASTGIKAASPVRPQSGCPCRDGKQKKYGLGCSLAVSVYGKNDGHTAKAGALDYCACSFVDSQRAADYQTAAGIRNIIADNGKEDDIFAFLVERNIPVRRSLADEYGERIVAHPAPQLAISPYILWPFWMPSASSAKIYSCGSAFRPYAAASLRTGQMRLICGANCRNSGRKLFASHQVS